MSHIKDSKQSQKEAFQNSLDGKTSKRRNPFRIQLQKEKKEKRQKKRARLIVRNICYKTTEIDLRNYFGQWGKLVDVNILKHADGKVVGCAFIQYETINQATKAILKGNGEELLGRKIFIDWALGKSDYVSKRVKNELLDEKDAAVRQNKIKSEKYDLKVVAEVENNVDENKSTKDSEIEEDSDEEFKDGCDKKNFQSKFDFKVGKEKHDINDLREGCTIFIKNVPFDADDTDLSKLFRKFGPLYYAIINRDPVSGHSKGTAFVKFKSKESADLCLQSAGKLVFMDQVVDPYPALSKEEIHQQHAVSDKKNAGKDSRNLYLAREGLIMANSKAAEGVSAADMNQRHKLEQVKIQVLKNLNRFVSRNRLSIHNLPINYDNEHLKDMVIAYTGFKPHECRVMRENLVSAEHPKGKSKRFGFMSFNSHQEALIALRKLNNNPKIFGTQHRPIVAFSIEDRGVYKVKEKRLQKSILNNPTYKEKLEKEKSFNQKKCKVKLPHKQFSKVHEADDKNKIKEYIKKIERYRAEKYNLNKKTAHIENDYVGAEAKPGTSLRLRSLKKIEQQSKDHLKRVKNDNKKQKRKHMLLTERKADIRQKQGHKVEKDELVPLVNKYKHMMGEKVNEESISAKKKQKRTKWYQY